MNTLYKALTTTPSEVEEPHLSTRDYFAIRILAALLAADTTEYGKGNSHKGLSNTAYSIADAMMAAGRRGL